MSARRIQVIPKRVYDFSRLQLGINQTVIAAERIDVTEYVEVMFCTRIHALDLSGGTILGEVYFDGHSVDDPGATFVGTWLGAVALVPGLAQVAYTGGAVCPAPFLGVRLIANRLSGAPLNVTLSADLILRCPDDALTT